MTKSSDVLEAPKVDYADLVGGCDGPIMVLRLRGVIDANLKEQFLIFENRLRDYPMMNLPDNPVLGCTKLYSINGCVKQVQQVRMHTMVHGTHLWIMFRPEADGKCRPDISFYQYRD